jgi:hypothetical protein
MGRMPLWITLATFLVLGGGNVAFTQGIDEPITFREAHLDQEFDLMLHEAALIKEEELVVTLKSVNNSHCPVNVTCIWEGIFVATLELSKSISNPMLITLYDRVTSKASDHGEYLDFNVRFISYKGCTGEITESKDCSVRLLVTRKP